MTRPEAAGRPRDVRRVVVGVGLRPGAAGRLGDVRRVVVGVGLRSGAAVADLADLVGAALLSAGAPPAAVAALATLDRRAAEPAVRQLAARHGWPVIGCAAGDLDGVAVPGDARVRRAVGTGSVAEAAALLAAGPGAELLVPKTTGRAVTVAVAVSPAEPG
ncbi:cobalamin biosynthesis protein [Jidongwangia harbinensis]|uniref:cobalamin biosynthesis protein n=1 Tax=Jidongwangia harbinensis TaxID=2878561 RepID=UPI001CD96CD3|nr:cobalamin biosynthesis protein [Jidongwangia harbinensis]MCA2218812.1 cobalamin biosynthesis protein [Jidongwangia harbinensis]